MSGPTTRFHALAIKEQTSVEIDTNVLTVDQMYNVMQAEAGVADDVQTITNNFTTLTALGVDYRPLIFVVADAGDTITLKHKVGGSDNLDLPDDTDIEITEDKPAWLVWNGTYWNAFHSGSDGTVTSVATGTGLQGGPVTTTGTIDSDVSHRFNARLTLSATLPITTTSLDNQTDLYLLPFKGNIIDLYDGSGAWDAFELGAGGITIDNTDLVVDSNYDVFVYDDSGLALELLVWTDGTNRATALALQDGIEVKTGATTRRYAGTIRTVDDAATAKFADTSGGIDTLAERFVYNRYNQVHRFMRVGDSTDTWVYNGTWRSLNNSAVNRVSFVQGLNESPVKMLHTGKGITTAVREYFIGVALDATNVNSCFLKSHIGSTAGHLFLASEYFEYPGIGFHFLQLTENSPDGNVTATGDGGAAADTQFGGQGWLMG